MRWARAIPRTDPAPSSLARLLTPADFGIVTIAMIILGTVEIFTQTGQHLAIIRHPNPPREHYDTAWTIFIMLYSTLALINLSMRAADSNLFP